MFSKMFSLFERNLIPNFFFIAKSNLDGYIFAVMIKKNELFAILRTS